MDISKYIYRDSQVIFNNNSNEDSPIPLGLSNEFNYNLYGVINHIGSLESGHYTITLYDEKIKKWLLYNDNSIHKIEESDVITNDAYVLFYYRQDIKNKDINCKI